MDGEIRVAGIISDSIVDGPGLRLCIFFQGCPHNCPGCHNPETHDFDAGTLFDTEKFIESVRATLEENPLLSGVTFSGGEPISQVGEVIKIARAVVEMKKDITLFTGYTYEELLEMNNPDVTELLSYCNLLIDGRFILAERDLTLKFRGSRNQRLINAAESLKQGKIVGWKSKFEF